LSGAYQEGQRNKRLLQLEEAISDPMIERRLVAMVS